MNRIWYGIGFVAALMPVQGAITNIRMSGVTSTQAVLAYTAPDGGACGLEVSESTGYSPLVPDVDPSKFGGANRDNRPGNPISGSARVFVIGKRAAERGSDGIRYSRALQTSTQHFYRITCPSTGDTAIGQFQTRNIPMGITYVEPQPVDAAAPGEYAWPTLSLSDRSQKIVDPFTGALIRRVSMPQDRVVTDVNQNQRFGYARSSTWATPAQALSNQDGSLSSTINGNNAGTLLLTAANNGFLGYISFLKGSRGANLGTLNWFQVILNASTSRLSCNNSPTDDCKIVVCLTIDGVNCYAGGNQFDQLLTTGLTNYSFGTTGTAIDLWQGAGVRPPNAVEVATRGGMVTCDGSTFVAYTSGDLFGTYWSPGSTITVNNVDYSIASVNSLTSVTLKTACPTTNGASTSYASANFGVLIRKKTASADTVSIQYASSNYQTGTFPTWTFTGGFDLCGPTPVIGPTGNAGYNCALSQNGAMYWIDGVTGESHLLARYMGGSCGVFDSIVFDALNPDIFYCGGTSPTRVQYFGNHSDPMNTVHPGHFEENENLPSCNSGTTPTNQPCLYTTNLTGSNNLSILTNAFDSRFQMDRFPTFYFVGIEQGLMVFRVYRGPYTSIAWTVIFDPNTSTNGQAGNLGCVGGTAKGCVIAAAPSWSSRGARWCPLKGNDPLYQPGWAAIGSYIWGADNDTRPGVGPYLSKVVDGTAFASAGGVSGGLSACPPNSLGVTGSQCTTVTVDGEPRDPSPCVSSISACNGAMETGLPGELMAAAVGDEFTIGPATASEEIMRLIAKGGTNNLTWTFQRGVNGTLLNSSANMGVYAFCSANPDPTRQASAGGEFYWNYAADPHGTNSTGTTVLGDYYSINAHGYIESGASVTAYSLDPRCNGGYGYDCYNLRTYTSIPQFVTTPPVTVTELNPFFAGKYSLADGDHVQSHASTMGINAAGSDRGFFLDGRPFNGSELSGSGNGNGSSPAGVVGGQLYRFTASQMAFMDRKFLPTFAFVGSKPLLDVSSTATGNVIGIASADAYKYCVAVLANECRSGSSAGDVYVNAPFVNRAYCYYPGQANGMPDEYDICISNNAAVYNSLMQVGLNWLDNYGRHQRVLTKALERNRLTTPFWNVHALANSRWLITKTEYAENIGDMVLAVKIPPPPPDDTVNHGDFVPVLVNAHPPAGSQAANAIVEFGYAENGSAASFFCTSRAEVCAVGQASNAQSVNTNNPFYFETTESASLAGTPCASACSIAVPGISQHVVYARIVYRNSSNSVVSRGNNFAIAVP